MVMKSYEPSILSGSRCAYDVGWEFIVALALSSRLLRISGDLFFLLKSPCCGFYKIQGGVATATGQGGGSNEYEG
jgi:hypothetical protein